MPTKPSRNTPKSSSRKKTTRKKRPSKDLKRLTRARMEKTGESYTAARSKLLAKKKSSSRAASIPRNLAEIAGMSDDAVRAKTGRTWRQWVTAIDALDVIDRPHKEIAKRVHAEFDISGWWAQMVTVAYERIRGLREVGQKGDGSFQASKSKTVQVPIAKLYRAFSIARTRRRWLGDVELTVRKSTPEKSMRITWDDGSAVDVYFTAKGAAKSQVAIQHRKLASKADIEERKRFWGERLADLASLLK